MAKFSTEALRTVALVGHGASGKTTLAEALLHKAGMIQATGTVERGATVCDFDPLEKQFLHSLRSAVVHLDYAGTRTHLIDTPGYPDFLGHAADYRDIAARFSAVFFKGLPLDKSGRYLVEHTSQIYLVDREGRLRATFTDASAKTIVDITRTVLAETG